MALSKMAKQYMIDKLGELNIILRDTHLDPHADKGHSFDRIINDKDLVRMRDIIDSLVISIEEE